jgi:tetratricopeptide (TPR) repeat protein
VFRFWTRFASPRSASPRAAALAALRRRDFLRAERELTDLLAASPAPDPPERAFLLNKRGVARVYAKRLEAAQEDFFAATQSVANYPPALTNLGNLLLERGEVQAAIASYEAAIAADPQYALAHVNLAAAYKRAGRVEDAVRTLRHAQRLDNKSIFLRRRLRS